MDFDFSDDQIQLGDAVRKWVDKGYTFERRRAAEKAGGFDRANLAVDALNRVVVGWVSQPDGYEKQQVAARVLALDEIAKTITPLTGSFLPFINAAQSGGIGTVQMSIAMTTRQICVAAKGEINLQNKPEQGAFINPNTGEPLKEINFYTVFTHPNPQADPTPPVGGVTPTLGVSLGSNGNVTISWSAGVLESSTSANGTWTPLPSLTSPLIITPTEPSILYRVRY